MTSVCIVCHHPHYEETVEHIIPKSLGNEYYVLPRGKVCYRCNNRFAKVENQVVSSDLFMQERKRFHLTVNDDQATRSLSEEQLCYLVVKMGYEGMYRSRKQVFSTFNWNPVRRYLNERIPYEILKDRNLPANVNFKSIPGWVDKFRLSNNHLLLEYGIIENQLYIRFQFGKIMAWIRVI